MEKKEKGSLILGLLVLVLCATAFRGCSAAFSKQLPFNKKKNSGLFGSSLNDRNRIGSSAVFPVVGNVYPIGYFYATLSIGNPPKPYFLDIDSGSDLTWLQCDAPCVSCSKVPHPLYKPNLNSLVVCTDPICKSLHTPSEYKCEKPTDQCDYEVEYADSGSSLGVLVRDVFAVRFLNGSILGPRLAFGCGYDQQVSRGAMSPTDGVLGLGNGESSIVSQLRNVGLIRNVIGHCLSRRGGGYLFFGDNLVPSSGVAWTPMSRISTDKHYSPGPAELFYGKQSTGLKGLPVVFDSGSSYTYFNRHAYQVFLNLVRKDLAGKPLQVVDDKTLPVCWKGRRPFKSVLDVKNFFKPVALGFANKKTQMEMPPENYLIVTSFGNACLGILNGTEIGLHDLNLIGDISFQDQMVIYDNEKQQIGWIRSDCNRLPNKDRVDDIFQHYTANMGIFRETATLQENKSEL